MWLLSASNGKGIKVSKDSVIEDRDQDYSLKVNAVMLLTSFMECFQDFSVFYISLLISYLFFSFYSIRIEQESGNFAW